MNLGMARNIFKGKIPNRELSAKLKEQLNHNPIVLFLMSKIKLNSEELSKTYLLAIGLFFGVLFLYDVSSIYSFYVTIPFCTSLVIIFSQPFGKFSKLKNITSSYFLAALVGLLCLKVIPLNGITLSIAIALIFLLLTFFELMHPPALAITYYIFNTANTVNNKISWGILINPVLIGIIFLSLVTLALRQFIKTYNVLEK